MRCGRFWTATAEGSPANLVVASDDVALPFGMIRVRARGSAGGQKGLMSIIERLGSQEFSRIRLGVMPDHPVSDFASFVLSPIPRRDGTAFGPGCSIARSMRLIL